MGKLKFFYCLIKEGFKILNSLMFLGREPQRLESRQEKSHRNYDKNCASH